MADTDDTPTKLAILPDWNRRVRLVEEWDSNATRSFAGKEQRSAKRVKPIYRLEYFRSGMTETEARRRLLAIRSEFEGPLIVPFWPDGGVLASTMTTPVSDDVAVLENALPDGYDSPFEVYIYDEANGGEFRTVTSVSGASLTLDGSSTLYTTGAFVFPCRKVIREIDAEGLNSINAETGIERIRYLSL
jgi:hypothetical protein